jgi:hypothetical protein
MDDIKEEWQLMAEYEGIIDVQEAKLTYAERSKLPATSFCGPNRSYPANDEAHVRAGLQRLSQFGSRLKPAVRARIQACLRTRAKRFGIKVAETVQLDAIVQWYLDEKGLKK